MSRLLPSWFWVIVFSISIMWMLYLGINPQEITKWWRYLLGYNLGFSLLATVLIIQNIRHLKKQENAGFLGSKLTTSFVKIVPLIAILPLVSFYFFSFNNIQGTVSDIQLFAQDLQRERQQKLNGLVSDLGALKLTEFQGRTQSLLNVILQNNSYAKEHKKYQPIMQAIAKYLIDLSLVCDITIYDGSNKVLAQARDDNQCPKALKKTSDFFQLSLYSSDEIPEARFFKSQALYSQEGVVHLKVNVVYSLDKETNNFLKKLNQSRHSQLNIELNLAPLRKAFLVDMSSTLLLTILSVLMIIFKIINSLMKPLNRLSEATKQVAKGDYDVFIAQEVGSDAGILIDLFNDMAKQVKGSQAELNTERVYLQTILKYSYGVIALDEHHRIRLLNPEVSKILKVHGLDKFYQQDYFSITQTYTQLSPLTQMIKAHFDANEAEWHESIEITLEGHPVLIFCQGATLIADNEEVLGYVIILKDITQLRQAQNKAAWAAVAMKMAHEVKNPLTPIQLCAERLRNRILPKLAAEDAKILDKTTKTITQQVKSINTLISAFAQYTQTPVLDKNPQLLSELVKQTIQLYEGHNDIKISTYFDKNESKLLLDASSIGRVLINLIKNAIEASINKPLLIDISIHHSTNGLLKLMIEDNGPGVPKNIEQSIFEPYVSTKSKGGGLGMVIVKSVLTEHNASINITNRLKDEQIIGASVAIDFKITQG